MFLLVGNGKENSTKKDSKYHLDPDGELAGRGGLKKDLVSSNQRKKIKNVSLPRACEISQTRGSQYPQQ